MDAEQIQASLKTESLGKKVYFFESIDSTNAFAKRLDESASPHGTLIVAEEQTAGRGRLGRQWESPKGKNLLFSLVFRTPFLQERARVLPFLGALAVADSVEKAGSFSVECKWPNDLLLRGKKFAGILIEAVTHNETVTSVVMGIGVNINQTKFAGELQGRATSLRLHVKDEIDRLPLLCRVVEEIEHRLHQLRHFSTELVIDEWKRRSTMLGKTISLIEQGTSSLVRAVDVAPSGALVVEDANGRRREVFAGEVSLA